MFITKKIIGLLISLLLILLISSCSKSPEEQLVGEWRGTDSGGGSIIFIFNGDESASMIMGNIVLDGSSNGVSLKWKLFDTYTPMHLDIIGRRQGKTKFIRMIARFVGENKLQIRLNNDLESRPTDFTTSNDKLQALLIRQ